MPVYPRTDKEKTDILEVVEMMATEFDRLGGDIVSSSLLWIYIARRFQDEPATIETMRMMADKLNQLADAPTAEAMKKLADDTAVRL